jgi:hypothetical protein
VNYLAKALRTPADTFPAPIFFARSMLAASSFIKTLRMGTPNNTGAPRLGFGLDIDSRFTRHGQGDKGLGYVVSARIDSGPAFFIVGNAFNAKISGLHRYRNLPSVRELVLLFCGLNCFLNVGDGAHFVSPVGYPTN